MLQHIFMDVDWGEVNQAILDTLFMLSVSVFFSALIGIPLGIVLYLTDKGRILQNRIFYLIFSFIINLLRSIPFIILLIIMMPFTIMLVGTSLGAKGVIPPLIFGAFPFFTRLVENSLKEVDNGVLDMAKAYGATTWQIIRHILLPEVMPGIIASITVTAITLVSYTAMAGTVGGGGLGDLAIRYGYQRFQTNIMVLTVVLLVVLVQLIQFIGDKIVRFMHKK
ncbi:MAG: metal transporter permease [Burkholderiales bacterium]|nr:metal transporter permease [Burkholderiales bacterium]MCE3268166.1 metal transporter permease [Burkholderiales bacterium]